MPAPKVWVGFEDGQVVGVYASQALAEEQADDVAHVHLYGGTIKPTVTKRKGVNGGGSIFFDEKRKLYTARLSLPPGLDGKPRRKTVRAKTHAEVVKKLAAIKKLRDENGDVATSSMTVEAWLDYWMQGTVVKTLRPAAVRSARSHIAWVKEAIGKVRLDQVRPDTIRRVFDLMDNPPVTARRRNPKPAASTYKRNVHSTMSAAFAAAEREGKIPRNPVELVLAPRKRNPELDSFEPDEAADLIRNWGDNPDTYLWLTFLLTGARRGEVLGLEWDRIISRTVRDPKTGLSAEMWFLDMSWQLQRASWEHRCGDKPAEGEPWKCGFKYAAYCPHKRLSVPEDYEWREVRAGLYWTRPKTNKGWRIIPLVDPLLSVLQKWKTIAPKNPYGLVFTRAADTSRPRWAHLEGEQIPLDPDWASRHWDKVREASGVTKDVRLHDVRHSTAALLYAAGVDEELIEAILGHSTAAMSRHYRGRVDPARLQAAMLQVTAHVTRG
jgi:integrase